MQQTATRAPGAPDFSSDVDEVISHLDTEVTTPEEEITLPQFDTPGEKLAFIRQRMTELATLASQVTRERFITDSEEFHSIAEQIEKQILEIEALLVYFEARVQADYNPPTIVTKIGLFFVSFIVIMPRIATRANRLRSQFKKSKAQKKAFIEARSQYQRQLNKLRNKIYRIVNYEVLQLQGVILSRINRYQKVLREVATYEAQSYSKYRNQRIATLKGEIEIIENNALTLAQEIFEGRAKLEPEYIYFKGATFDPQ
jgi:uncharacterized protein YicC (UPF0701 family)